MLIQSENMSQETFIRTILERDARNIYRAQQLIVSQRIYLAGKDLKATRRKKGIGRRSGRLENAVSNPDFIIQSKDETFTLALTYPLHIRFLDMRSKGNWKIYRYPIWGIIYNRTISDIKTKYGEVVTNTVGEALRNAFEKYNKK